MKEIEELAQIMVISTRHISRQDNDRLADRSYNLGGGAWCEPLSHGLLLVVEPEGDPDEVPAVITDALTGIVTFARKWSIDYVRIDPDGPVQSGLKTYEW